MAPRPPLETSATAARRKAAARPARKPAPAAPTFSVIPVATGLPLCAGPKAEQRFFERLLGRPLGNEPDGRYVVVANHPEMPNGCEPVGEAPSMLEAMRLLARVSYAIAELTEESDTVRLALPTRLTRTQREELVFTLSEEQLIARETSLDRCGYMDTMKHEHLELDLVIAWEAEPPLQDAAFGIFVERPRAPKPPPAAPKPRKPARRTSR